MRNYHIMLLNITFIFTSHNTIYETHKEKYSLTDVINDNVWQKNSINASIFESTADLKSNK